MASNSPFFLLHMFLIFTILLAVTQATLAARKVPTKANVADKKQPEWFIGNDGNVFIPGIGRMQVPPLSGASFLPPPSGLGGGVGNIGGGGGDSGTGSTGGTGGGSSSSVPGGDDTFVPNPGVEVPIGSGGDPQPQTASP